MSKLSELLNPGEPLPEGDDKARAVQTMFDSIAPRYDLVNRIMTFGLDTRWRRRTIAEMNLPTGSVVLDIAAGTGDFCRELEASGITAIGVDFSLGMLQSARTEASLVQADALNLPMPNASVDGATCGFALRNLVELEPFFNELARTVRPGGRVALIDVGVPNNPILRFGHGIYFGKIVPIIGGLISNPAAYRYLPKSVQYLPEPPQLLGMLRAAGFSDATHTLLPPGAAQLLVGTRDD